MHTLPSLTFVTMDGAEREFRLSMAYNRRLAKHGIGPHSTIVECIAPVLYEALVDKAGLTLEQFEELLPPDHEICVGFYQKLSEHCNPKANERYRPTKPEPEPEMKPDTTTHSSETSGSGDSGPSDSVETGTNSGS